VVDLILHLTDWCVAIYMFANVLQ